MKRPISLILCGIALLITIERPAVAGDLKTYIADSAKAARSISSKRRKLLDPIASSLAGLLKEHGKAAVVFVCTHNSRRSQFSQVWAHTAAAHYQLKNVTFASGGTEATAANIRTIAALRRAGLSIREATPGINPVYAVSQPGDPLGCRLFSKVYSDQSNPRKRFVAVLCCSDADEKCPVVDGAESRHSLHYIDPKVADGTARENATYDERCRQIAAEMFYLVSRVKELSKATNGN